MLRLAENGYFRLAGQYTNQRSDGANLLTGKGFSTANAQGYAEYGIGMWTLYGAYSRTGSGADLRTPFTSGPIYTQQVVRSFVRAHETAWQLGIGTDFSTWVPGVTAYFDVTRGTDAINASTGASVPNAIEYNIGAVWTHKKKGSFFDNMRARIRYARVIDSTTLGDRRTTDPRIDVNLPISFL